MLCEKRETMIINRDYRQIWEVDRNKMDWYTEKSYFQDFAKIMQKEKSQRSRIQSKFKLEIEMIEAMQKERENE